MTARPGFANSPISISRRVTMPSNGARISAKSRAVFACTDPARAVSTAASATLYSDSALSSAAWLMNFCATRLFVRS